VQYAGLAPSYVGLYQFDVVAPAIRGKQCGASFVSGERDNWDSEAISAGAMKYSSKEAFNALRNACSEIYAPPHRLACGALSGARAIRRMVGFECAVCGKLAAGEANACYPPLSVTSVSATYQE
jgi:hypothetical protein